MKSISYPAESRQTRIAAVIGPAILAIFIGAFLVFGAGLAHPSTIHDFAHDFRHALAFPCH